LNAGGRYPCEVHVSTGSGSPIRPPSAVSNDLFGHAPLSPLPLGQGEGEGPQGLAHLHTDPHPPPSGATVSAQGAALPEGRGSLRPLPSMPKEVSWTCTRAKCSNQAEPRHAGDGFQRPLRSRLQPRLI